MVVSATATALFSMFYILFTAGLVLQFREFASAGLSPDALLMARWTDMAEEITFVQYHLRRTAATLVLHSALPLGYVLGYSYFTSHVDGNHANMVAFWRAWPSVQYLMAFCIAVPIATAAVAVFWSHSGWSGHPFVKKFLPYCTPTSPWTEIVKDINTEYRRIDKFVVSMGLKKVAVTDNWVMVVGQWPWQFHLAHQSDIGLDLVRCDHHNISTEGQAGGTQYLSIAVTNRKPNAENFTIRLNSLEYQNLQDKIQGPIQNMKNIQIFKTVSERFVEVFREEVRKNDRISTDEDLDSCIGCMVNGANVKLVRRCGSENDAEDACVNCYCRPMWCLDCMGKWFASRQNQRETETWLGSKCPCPTCRSRFCILDVSIIE